MSIASHVMIRLASNQVLAPSTESVRALVNIILRLGADRTLLVFAVVDSHIHALLLCPRAEAVEFARRVEIAWQLTCRFGVPFSPCHVKPVDTQAHLQNAFFYILRQLLHHGLELDPLREGSAISDLLGLRVRGLYLVTNVRGAIPRAGRPDLLPFLGDVDLQAEPTEWAHLAQAAAAAYALPDLSRSDVLTRRAISAGAALGRQWLSAGEVAELLGRSLSSLRRLRLSYPPPPVAVEAVRRQVVWRSHVLGAVPSSADPLLADWSAASGL